MKHCIPIQMIGHIEIECIDYNLETDYFKFSIQIDTTVHNPVKIKLTQNTLDLITRETKKIVKKIKGEIQ